MRTLTEDIVKRDIISLAKAEWIEIDDKENMIRILKQCVMPTALIKFYLKNF